MKKLVIAAAVLGAFAGTAQAQSSVTLFGVVDTDFVHISQGGAGSGNSTANKNFFDNSGINSSRIGVRGTEDLGGGLKAGFWLEAGINTNAGSGSTTSANNETSTGGGGLTFNRRSTVSLIGDRWGEVRIGRDYVPTFWNAANVDPFGYNGIGEIASLLEGTSGAMGPAFARASNGISYLTPNTLGGFFLQATVATGNNADNAVGSNGLPAPATAATDTSKDGDYYGMNIGYQNGPIYAGLAFAETRFAQTTEIGDYHTINLGVSYDFGFVKPDIFYQTSNVFALGVPAESVLGEPNGKATTEVYSLGAVVPLGQGEFRANYAHASGSDAFSGNNANMFALAYIYNLSKRTALYAQYARIQNHGCVYNFTLNGYAIDAADGNTETSCSGATVPTEGVPTNETTSGVAFGLRTSF